jgi:hypothetical protein
MRRHFLLVFICACLSLQAKPLSADSTRLITVFDHTLRIPSSFQHVTTDTNWCASGYITDGIDTLYYNKCMAMMPMCIEMMYYTCGPYEDSAECAAINAEVRRYNDSLRKEDPRIGNYNFSCEHGDGCWYEKYSPKPGVTGYFALEISAESRRRQSFLLSTTVIEPDRQNVWREILASISE